MKRSLNIVVLATVMVLAFSLFAYAATPFGPDLVNEGETYTVEEMLTYALQNEYANEAQYKAIMDEFEIDRPFSNILRAEQMHAEWLLPLFDAYHVEVPEIDGTDYVDLPETLDDVFANGVASEERSISMYEIFLDQEELPDDLKDVFEYLKFGSENHLRAFSRQSDGTFPSTRSGFSDMADRFRGFANRFSDTSRFWGRGRR